MASGKKEFPHLGYWDAKERQQNAWQLQLWQLLSQKPKHSALAGSLHPQHLKGGTKTKGEGHSKEGTSL